MKFVQPPLKITCDGLSQKLIFKLADRLVPLFKSVEVFGDEISASTPLSNHHYETAWQILDKFGVKVT